MKKLIAVISVFVVLVFSCALTSFAEATGQNILTLKNLSDSRFTIASASTASISNGVVTMQKDSYFLSFIRVQPVSATRKYKFNFHLKITSATSSFSGVGTVTIYYKDSQTGKELVIYDITKLTNKDNIITNTITMPDDFGSSGRIYFSYSNSMSNTAKITVSDFTVNDMTTADLDDSLDRFGNRIDNIINPSEDYSSWNNGDVSNKSAELESEMNKLPTVNYNEFESMANSIDLSEFSTAFASINQLFIRIVDTVGVTPLIFFALFFGICIFLIGRKLSGG